MVRRSRCESVAVAISLCTACGHDEPPTPPPPVRNDPPAFRTPRIVGEASAAIVPEAGGRVPIDAARLPAGAGPADVRVSGLFGGYIVEQGAPDSVDVVGARATWILDPPLLRASPAVLGPPMGIAVPFAMVTRILLGVTVGAHLLTVYQTTSLDWSWAHRQTEHFDLYYRTGGVSDEQLTAIADSLERTHALVVDGLGFSLPNISSVLFRYSVMIDDFASHSLVPDERTGGFTIAGSSLLAGRVFLNTRADPSEWPITASHEYVHAVQWGALLQVTAMNNAALSAYPES